MPTGTSSHPSSLGVSLPSPRAAVDQRLPLGATWAFADMLAKHLDTISGHLITGTIPISVMIPTDNVKLGSVSSREPASPSHRGSANDGVSGTGSTPPPNPLAATATHDAALDTTSSKMLSETQTFIRGDLFNGASVEAVRASLDCIHKVWEDLTFLSHRLRTASVTYLEGKEGAALTPRATDDISLPAVAEASTLSSWSAPTRPTSGAVIPDENANSEWQNLKNFYQDVMAVGPLLHSPDATPRGEILTVESKDNSLDERRDDLQHPLTNAKSSPINHPNGAFDSDSAAIINDNRKRSISTIAQMHAYIVQYEVFKASTHAAIVSGGDHATTALTIASLLDRRSTSSAVTPKPPTAASSQNTNSIFNITVTGAEDNFVSIPMLSVEGASAVGTPAAPPLGPVSNGAANKYFASINSSTGAVASSFSFGGMGANTLHSIPSNIMSSRLNATVGSAGGGGLSQVPSQANLLASSVLAPTASAVWGASQSQPHGKKEKIQGIENEVNTSVAEWLNENFTQESDKRRKAKAQVVPSSASAGESPAAGTPANGEILGMSDEGGSLQNTLRTNGEVGSPLNELAVSNTTSEGIAESGGKGDAILGKDGPALASSGEWASDSDDMADSARRGAATNKGGLYSRKTIDDRDGILSEASVRALLQQFRIPYLDVDNPDFDIFKEIDLLEKEQQRRNERNKTGDLKSNLSIPPTSMFDPASDAPTPSLSLSTGGGKGARKRAETTNMTTSRLQRKPENIFLFVCMNVMLRYVFVNNFNINIRKLIHYLSMIQSLYRTENPYHNSLHAADVLQTTHIYLTSNGVHHNFSDLEIFCLLFSALVHDVGHLGVNNVFLSKIRHPIAVLYNDKSPLENMHTSIALHIFNIPEYNFLADGGKWTPDMDSDFRHLVTDIISGTDMKFHASIIANVNDILADGVIEDEEISMLMKAIVHAADLSNPMKPKHLYLNWMRRINEEFWVQGDEERAHGLPISVMCDRRTTKLPESQVGFINFIVKPFVSAFSVLLPNVWVARLEENLAFMIDQVAKNKAAASAPVHISPFALTASPSPSVDPQEFTAGPATPVGNDESDNSVATGTGGGGEEAQHTDVGNTSDSNLASKDDDQPAPLPLARKESIHWQSPDGAAIEMDPETGEVLNSRPSPGGARRPSLVNPTPFATHGSKKNLTGPKKRNVTISADGEVPNNNASSGPLSMDGTITHVHSAPTSPELKTTAAGTAPSISLSLPLPDEEACNEDLLKYTDLIFTNTDRGGGIHSDRFVKFLCLPGPIEGWVDTFRPLSAYMAPRSMSSPPITPTVAAASPTVAAASSQTSQRLGGSSSSPSKVAAIAAFQQPCIQTVFAQIANIKITPVHGLSSILNADVGAAFINPSPASSFISGDPRFGGSPGLNTLLTTSVKYDRNSLSGVADVSIPAPIDPSVEKNLSLQSISTGTNSRVPSGTFQHPVLTTTPQAATAPAAAVLNLHSVDQNAKEAKEFVSHIPIHSDNVSISVSEAAQSARLTPQELQHKAPSQAAALTIPDRVRSRSDASEDLSILGHTAAPVTYSPLLRRGSMGSILTAAPMESAGSVTGDSGVNPDTVVAWYLEMLLPQLEARGANMNSGGGSGKFHNPNSTSQGSLIDSPSTVPAFPSTAHGESGPSSEAGGDIDVAFAQSVLRFWLPHVTHPLQELLPAAYLDTPAARRIDSNGGTVGSNKAIRPVVDAVKAFADSLKSLAGSTTTERTLPEGEVPSSITASSNKSGPLNASASTSREDAFAMEAQRLVDAIGSSVWPLLLALADEVAEVTRKGENTAAANGIKHISNGLNGTKTNQSPSPLALPFSPLVRSPSNTPLPLIKHLLGLSAALWVCTNPNSSMGGAVSAVFSVPTVAGRRGSRLAHSHSPSHQLPPLMGAPNTLSPVPLSIPTAALGKRPVSQTIGTSYSSDRLGPSYAHSPSKYIFKGRASVAVNPIPRTGASDAVSHNQTYPNPGSAEIINSPDNTMNTASTPARVLRPLRYQHLWMSSPSSVEEGDGSTSGSH